MERPANRLEEWVDKLMLKIDLDEDIDALKVAFLPFRNEVKTVQEFRKWLSDIEQIKLTRGMKLAGHTIRQPETQRIFLEAQSELYDSVSKKFNFDNGLVVAAIVEKTLFGGISNTSLGVSHKIKNAGDDIENFAYAEIYVEPGASKPELIKYIEDNWSEIDRSLKNSISSKHPLSKKVKPKEEKTKNLEWEAKEFLKANPDCGDEKMAGHLRVSLSQARKIMAKIKSRKL
ncbi:MAG TPA: hypothetical protein VFQ72_02275 [Candidatus Paceibacterota bacterium]|nr:hypothetical protein [Candidatus Paceibacterota bacterium]